ncbi:MAG: toxin-antitoxin system HicB family antitoxin [Cyanobacteria bacterium J06635_15]
METNKLNPDFYTYRVTWSQEDEEFVATCAEFPSLSWLEPSQEAALTGIRSLAAEVIRDLVESGEPVPEPLSLKAYSGNFMVRSTPFIHRKLATEAAEAGVSLNRLVNSKLMGG